MLFITETLKNMVPVSYFEFTSDNSNVDKNSWGLGKKRFFLNVDCDDDDDDDDDDNNNNNNNNNNNMILRKE
jgi:hypothetical protein